MYPNTLLESKDGPIISNPTEPSPPVIFFKANDLERAQTIENDLDNLSLKRACGVEEAQGRQRVNKAPEVVSEGGTRSLPLNPSEIAKQFHATLVQSQGQNNKTTRRKVRVKHLARAKLSAVKELGSQEESRGKYSSLGMAASGDTFGMVTNMVEGHPPS